MHIKGTEPDETASLAVMSEAAEPVATGSAGGGRADSRPPRFARLHRFARPVQHNGRVHGRRPIRRHDREEFVRFQREIRMPLLVSIPEARRYVRRFVVSYPIPAPDYSGRDHDSAVEAWFESMEDMNAPCSSGNFLREVGPGHENFMEHRPELWAVRGCADVALAPRRGEERGSAGQPARLPGGGRVVRRLRLLRRQGQPCGVVPQSARATARHRGGWDRGIRGGLAGGGRRGAGGYLGATEAVIPEPRELRGRHTASDPRRDPGARGSRWATPVAGFLSHGRQDEPVEGAPGYFSGLSPARSAVGLPR